MSVGEYLFLKQVTNDEKGRFEGVKVSIFDRHERRILEACGWGNPAEEAEVA